MLLAASCATVKNYPLVQAGKPASCIVLPDNFSTTEKHAADELSLFLEKVTGAQVAVQNAPAKDLYNIYLGTTEAKNIPRSAAIDKAVSKLQDDGFVLAADKEGVRIISKKPLGVLYGAYEVLKKYAGMRWFAPGSDNEYCPKNATIVVPEQVTVSNPSFKVRTIGVVCIYNQKTIDTWDWLVRNGMFIHLSKYEFNNYRDELEKRGAMTSGGGHSFSSLLSDDLFDSHPEYFCLKNDKRIPQSGRLDLASGKRGRGGQANQPCTSNPKVVEIMIDGINQYLDPPPKGGIYLIGANDVTAWCQCENCVKLDPPEEKQKHFVSTRYYNLVNQIAGEVYKTHPGADLQAWAYQDYQFPPAGVVPDPRISIEACIHGRCYRHSMADLKCQANEKYRDMLNQWRKFQNPVSTLEYTDATTLLLYIPIEKTFAEDIKYYKKIGLAGCELFTVPPDGKFGQPWQAPRYRESMLSLWQTYYIAAQFFWNVEADYDQIHEDMGSKYYGRAWPVMREYRALLTKSFMETSGHILGHGGTPGYMAGKCLEKPGVEARLRQLLDEAEKLAGDDQSSLKRIKRDRQYFQSYWQDMRREFLRKLPQELNVNKRIGKIVIDGNFTEDDWQKTDFTTNFIVLDGETAADPQTFVKILCDDDNIYFAVEAMEPEPGKMKIKSTERDAALWADSSLEFFINAPMSEKYAHIILNPKGIFYDSMAVSGNSADVAFDSQAEISAVVLKDRWVAEVRIPTAVLGRKIKDGEVWKINVARNRCLIDGTHQVSSWCNGSFHSPEIFRSVAFGGAGLIQNGDFEDVEKISEMPSYQKTALAKWKCAGDSAPCKWSFHSDYAGEAAVMEDGAASGRRYLRLKSAVTNGLLIINQRLNINEADSLLVRAKVRGKGVVSTMTWLHDKKTGQFFGEPAFGEKKVDTGDWTNYEAIYNYDGQKYLTFALYVTSNDGLDLDDVTITRGKTLP